MTVTTIPLLAPTSRTVEGPRFSIRQGTLRLDYDVEEDDGSRTWHTVIFDEVLDFEYRSIAVCAEDDVVGSHVVQRRTASESLSLVVVRWEQSVGWQDWHQERGGRERFAEYVIFFDDIAAIEIVASGCKVES